MATLPELFDLADRYSHGGDLRQAERLYRQILKTDSSYAPAHANLGAVLHATGRSQDALACFEEAIRLNPRLADAHYNKGNVLLNNGNLAGAAACYCQALAINADRVDAINSLGLVLAMQGQLVEAAERFRQALRLCPTLADALSNLANVHHCQGQPAEAAEYYRQALLLKPNDADAHSNLGNALKEQGNSAGAAACFQNALRFNPKHEDALSNLGAIRVEQRQLNEAAECFRQILRFNPDHVGARNNLGIVLYEHQHLTEAAECFRQVLRFSPDDADVYNNLGNVLRDQGLLEEALGSIGQALRLNPGHAEAHNSMGNVLKEQGRLDDAIACYRTAIKLEPDNTSRQSNLLLSLLYHPHIDAHALLEEHRRYNGGVRRPAPSAADTAAFDNDPSPDRRLRIAYISPDFRDHVVGRNVWPLLRHHDHQQFEITLYAHPPLADALTEQFRQCADHWCPIAGWPDDRVVDKIRQDRIDILVDLALHTAGNRLPIFARKPAPLQVTFAGYPGTTGLQAIDYRLTDPYLDPSGLFDGCYAETSHRLPHSFWCYDPQTEEPAVAPLPALKKGLVTFGCLNNFCKINDEVLRLWSNVLLAVKDSRLLMLTKPGNHRRRTLEFLAQQGIAASRIEFYSFRPRPEYLALYHQVDIGLDTFPYNGHTTSLDSYWMGVPVITLVGQTVVGRAGLSQLTNLDLKELAAEAPQVFVRLAVELANDLPRLNKLRTGLRSRMKQSPLMDAAGFAQGIEHAYRLMWRRWCEGYLKRKHD